MDTPLFDFIKSYCESGVSRLHMPGHKGRAFLGCEAMDITEIKGADVLSRAEGIIGKSQENARSLFSSQRTYYSTEGSSICVRAMLYLAQVCKNKNALPIVLAARNVHQSFVYGAAAAKLMPYWIMPEGETASYCSCIVTPEQLERQLSWFDAPIAAVYVTSPDYLGEIQPIEELAEVCHRHGTILMVDNAHGAYLKFLEKSMHPLDLGADLCCDSAHKTLPVLTGGAYLHIGKNAPEEYAERAKQALSMFSSTSPSYLTMASLDLCNDYLDRRIASELKEIKDKVDGLKGMLKDNGWTVLESDPLRITLRTSENGISGDEAAEMLRVNSVECEFSDRDHLVLMVTAQNTEADLGRVSEALGKAFEKDSTYKPVSLVRNEQVMSFGAALLSPCEMLRVGNAVGRICASPVVSCPPAVPIAVCGERISKETAELLIYYGVEYISVVK